MVVVWLVSCGWLGAEPEVVEVVEVPEAASVEAPPAEDGPLAASHVLVAVGGAPGVDPSLKRTDAEARILAEAIRKQLVAGAAIEAVAAERSDDPSGPRGGRLGVFVRDAVDPAFAEAVAAVDIGEITEPFRTPYGWHVARRDPVEELRARHILVPYKGALHSSETHNEAHARRMMDMLATRLDRGADFAELAAEHSRDTTAPDGGELGPVGEGQLLPVLEQAIRKLRPGQRTFVQSRYGWHLLERTE